jgi:hypothetical protein
MFELNFPYSTVKWIGLAPFQAAMENNPFMTRAGASCPLRNFPQPETIRQFARICNAV